MILYESTEIILGAMKPGIAYRSKDLEAATNVKPGTIFRFLDQMVQAELLVRTGRHKGTRYHLSASAPTVSQARQRKKPNPFKTLEECWISRPFNHHKYQYY